MSLFAGVGGFDLGLERAGWKCVGQVEIDPYCRAVLAKHWPEVPRMEDVRDVQGHEFGPVDAVVGGFPCQPHSVAGKRLGNADERHLWPEYARIIRAIRPRWVVAENVPGLRTTAADEVIGDLEEAGYAVWPCVVGAWAVGAPHRRERVWIVAHSCNEGLSRPRSNTQRAGTVVLACNRCAKEVGEVVADAPGWQRSLDGQPAGGWRSCGAEDHAGSTWPSRPGEPQHEWEAPRLVLATSVGRETEGDEQWRQCDGTSWGDTRCGNPQPRLGDAVDGLPRRVAGFARRNALKALGNSIVPQVAEAVGRAINAVDGGMA